MTKRVYIYTNIFLAIHPTHSNNTVVLTGHLTKISNFVSSFCLTTSSPLLTSGIPWSTCINCTYTHLLWLSDLSNRIRRGFPPVWSSLPCTWPWRSSRCFFFLDEDPMVLWSSPVTKQKQQSHPKWAYICKTWICGVFFPLNSARL